MGKQSEFKGGLALPGKFRAGTPWILLVPTKEQLEFRARHGLGMFFGPWRLERDDVRLVYRTMRGLDTFHGLGFLRRDGTWWTFSTYHPNEVLDCLEELGYPMDPRTRQGQGRFYAR